MHAPRAIRVPTLVCLAALIGCWGCTPRRPNPDTCRSIDRAPVISPDYTGTTLPPNVAPTNFTIKEGGIAYSVRISSDQGSPIELCSRSPDVHIPVGPWKRLLDRNRDRPLRITVCVQDEKGRWSRFAPIENHVAAEPIDTHLVYRIIKPLYMMHDRMGLFQRDLGSFDERPILLNTATGGNCINCHSFDHYNPDRMMFHMRAGAVGTSMIVAYDGEVSKVDTKTSFNPPAAYRSWHPNGQIIAFSGNAVRQVFHAKGKNRDVYDRASDVFLYNVKTHALTTSPRISSPERMETYPEWSPDGQYLYFCSAPGIEGFDGREPPYNKIRYDLMRIAYNAQTDSWGEIEPVVLASQWGQSVAHPKVSPDGRYLLFCMSQYSNFPLYNSDSDLYLLDLRTHQWGKPENINSDRAESYHCWSSNGRWVVFSSKRQDGLCTHFYFSHFDSDGHFSKAFILPQKDPHFYDQLVIVYNIPEFVAGPIRIRPQRLIEAAWSRQIIQAQLDPRLDQKAGTPADEPLYTPSHGP